MNYNIIFDKPAQKFILKQPLPQRTRLLAAISKLPQQGDIKSLKCHEGFYRLRVGDYRVIYTVNNNILTVRIVNVGNRGDIYNQF